MMDLLPEEARKRNYVLDTCRKVFERYGFKPLETPIVEELGLLTKKGSAGEEIEKEIYSFKDKSDRELGLRFDLTVPLARVVAGNSAMRKPFKRYQFGKVYRYDKPGEKRYREFTQADVDIVGSNSILCEFEVLQISADVCKELGFNFYIKINSRKLLESIAFACSIKKERIEDCFRCIDKLDKIGWDGVKKELKANGIPLSICEILQEKDLGKLEKFLKEKNASLDGFNEVKQLLELVKKEGLEKFVKLDLSLARGLAYYTGMVFEVIAQGPSIAGGGRYDNLIELYGGQKTPAVGISFGVDRIMDCLEKKMQVEAQVIVIPLKKEFELKAFEFARGLRKENINTEFPLIERSISKNLEYADKEAIPFAVVLGEKEFKEKEFSLKNMESGKETKFKFSEIKKLKELIESK